MKKLTDHSLDMVMDRRQELCVWNSIPATKSYSQISTSQPSAMGLVACYLEGNRDVGLTRYMASGGAAYPKEVTRVLRIHRFLRHFAADFVQHADQLLEVPVGELYDAYKIVLSVIGDTGLNMVVSNAVEVWATGVLLGRFLNIGNDNMIALKGIELVGYVYKAYIFLPGDLR